MNSGYRPKQLHFHYRTFLLQSQEAAIQKQLLINHFLAKEMRSAQGFSNVTQQRGCSTLPPCLRVIRLRLLPARTWPRAISRLWLPTPAPSCAELLLSLCSLWVTANPSSSDAPGKSEPSHKSFPSKSTARNRKWKKTPKKQKTQTKKPNQRHQTPGFQSTYIKWQQIVTMGTFLPKSSEMYSITDGFSLEVCTYNPHNIY